MSFPNTESFDGQSESQTSKTVQIPPNVTPLYGFDPPPRRQWRVEDLVPDGHLTMLIGDGGTGKSFLALHLALCVASGTPFLGKEVLQGRVLYLDYELDADEQKRRTMRVAAGMDMHVKDDVLDKRIFHCRPEANLGSKGSEREVSRVMQLEPDLVIVDSLTVASSGDMKEHSDFNRVAREIQQWPTTLAIDHVSHSTAQKGSRDARAFGSVFKRNIARSSLTLGSRGDAYLLQQEKSNFTEGDVEVMYATEFSTEDVQFEPIEHDDERAASFLANFSTHEQTLLAIKQIHAESESPVSYDEILEWRRDKDIEISKASVRNHISKLKKREVIEKKHGEGAIPSDAIPAD